MKTGSEHPLREVTLKEESRCAARFVLRVWSFFRVGVSEGEGVGWADEGGGERNARRHVKLL